MNNEEFWDSTTIINNDANFWVVTLIRRGGEVSHLRDSSPSQAAVQNDGGATVITISENWQNVKDSE
ncbi:hypothetical protein [Cognataquiflexum rubidum]|uniref:hypothetical protein n=1 Tax=Cognataquiflexum rubidum TaxID=2922273 RepID=UPI001F12A2CE|nr:hypothetical protein [Cognataquiflexum rubidum]MCH6232847.1 hypothetical protein [Cognataquiflexum rubidum]